MEQRGLRTTASPYLLCRQNLYTVNKAFHCLGGGISRRTVVRLDNYHEQSHRCYPNDQKRQCGPVVLKPVFARAQRSFSVEGKQAAQIQYGKLNRVSICCCSRATRRREVKKLVLVINFLTLCGHLLVNVYLSWRVSWPTSFMKSCCIAA